MFLLTLHSATCSAFIARTSMTWRAVYWYLFAFEAFSLIMVVLFYRPPNFNTKHQRDHKTRWQLTKEMDWVGFSLFTLGCVLFLIGVNWGGRGYAWSSAEVIATLVVGTAVLVALGFYEVYAPLKYPMLPAKLFRNIRGFTMLLVLCFVSRFRQRSTLIEVPVLTFPPHRSPACCTTA